MKRNLKEEGYSIEQIKEWEDHRTLFNNDKQKFIRELYDSLVEFNEDYHWTDKHWNFDEEECGENYDLIHYGIWDYDQEKLWYDLGVRIYDDNTLFMYDTNYAESVDGIALHELDEDEYIELNYYLKFLKKQKEKIIATKNLKELIDYNFDKKIKQEAINYDYEYLYKDKPGELRKFQYHLIEEAMIFSKEETLKLVLEEVNKSLEEIRDEIHYDTYRKLKKKYKI